MSTINPENEYTVFVQAPKSLVPFESMPDVGAVEGAIWVTILYFLVKLIRNFI